MGKMRKRFAQEGRTEGQKENHRKDYKESS
jgi:hypothetical protein